MGRVAGVGGARTPVIEETLRARIEAWRAADPDPDTRDEVTALLAAADAGEADARAELHDRFDGHLAFGTAGLRAPLGAGPRRLNRLVVARLAAGLARWLAERGTRDPTVVVGWDARHRSADFALDVGRVVAAAGGRALLLPGPQPTPVLAFAVRHLGAVAGVMCTASHNPPSDNGAKVYLADGAQIAPPDDAGLAAAMAAVEGLPALAGPGDERIVRLGPEVVEDYATHVTGLKLGGPGGDLPIVYTPLHGVAGPLAVALLARSGFTDVDVVAEQAAPDPDFPTTPYPDPEEPDALARALRRARHRRAGLVLANDPDGDRLGAAVPTGPGAGWRILTGNEIGALLCEHVLSGSDGPDRLVVTTFVSSRLLGAIARHHGVHHVEVPTGFKWIVRPALAHPRWRFVFGFEEALGYSVDPFVRDKDGLAAAVAVAGLAAGHRLAGGDVAGELERLSRRHGHHAARTWSARLDRRGGAGHQRAVMDRWRSRPPTELAGRPVAEVRDLAAGADDLAPTDAVVVTGEDGFRVVLRPSGTEPKVKVYLEVVEPVAAGPGGYLATCRAGEAAVEALRRAVAADLGLGP